MNLQKLTIRILAATTGCFALSYAASVMGGINGKDSFPKSVGNLYLDATNPVVEVHFNKTIPVSSVQEVEVDSTSYEVTLTQVDGDEVQFSFKGRVPADNVAAPFEVSNEGGRIRIQPAQKRNRDTFHFGFEDEKGRLDVRVPKKIARLEIKTVSGDVQMSGFELSRLDLKAVSGDVNLNRAKCEEMKLTAVSGDVSVDGTVQRLAISSVSGDLKAHLENLDPQVDLKTTSGDGTVKFHTKPSLHLDFSTISGDLTVDPEFGQVENHGRKFSYNLGEGKGYLSVKTVSGDVKVGKF